MKNTLKQQLNNQKAALTETMFKGLGRMAINAANQSSDCCLNWSYYETKIPAKFIKK